MFLLSLCVALNNFFVLNNVLFAGTVLCKRKVPCAILFFLMRGTTHSNLCCAILPMMEKKNTSRKGLLERGRREKQLDELLRITKDTNKMLRGERNMRKVKMILLLVLVFVVVGYGYYLFEKHKIKIIEFQQRVEDLQQHLQEAGEIAGKVGDTAISIRGIFEGLESDIDAVDVTESVVDTAESVE